MHGFLCVVNNTQQFLGTITEEQITAAIDQLENAQQRDLIRQCLKKDPKVREFNEGPPQDDSAFETRLG